MNIPVTISSANLPRTYEAAKTALSECARVDECKDWADKAAALASYARQAGDDHLEKMAVRIRGRAVRREGELLKEIEPAPNHHGNSTKGDGPLSRKEAALAAGISVDHAKQAIRVANVPKDDFERQVESDNPPTVTALAKQGTKPRGRQILDLKGRDADEFNRAMHFVGDVRQAVKVLETLNLERDLPALIEGEKTEVRGLVARIDAMTDQIITRMVE